MFMILRLSYKHKWRNACIENSTILEIYIVDIFCFLWFLIYILMILDFYDSYKQNYSYQQITTKPESVLRVKV